jgi:glycosyltransferase involved in cell wall biosynthesis
MAQVFNTDAAGIISFFHLDNQPGFSMAPQTIQRSIRQTMPVKLLFITRNYPPRVGGLENYSYNLINEFEKHGSTWKIVLSKSKIHLFWFLPYCFFKSLLIIRRYHIDVLHLCDALLSPLGLLLKFMTGRKITTSVHGLDITFPNRFYQTIIPKCVSCLDMVVCVSRSTKDECIKRRVPWKKCRVIPNGVAPSDFIVSKSPKEARLVLENMLGTPFSEKKILLTVGRLVKRKGVVWFVETVMPRLDDAYIYIVAGDGPEYKSILEKINKHALNHKVFLLGSVSDKMRNLLYNGSDIFILPNISVKNDVEGFGIVAIEAGSCGLPVVASDIQGIRDAVLDGKTGCLVGEKDAKRFIHAVSTMQLQKDQIKSTVADTFGWPQIYEKYRKVFEDIHENSEASS